MSKERVVVIAPGRGTYNAGELGYLQRYHSDKRTFLDTIDAYRTRAGRSPVRVLDAAETWQARTHATSENASTLIYACALADFAAINRDRYEIVAVTGNSLGWYLALAAAGALNPDHAVHVVDSMGARMEAEGVGGQLVYPITDDDWRPSPERRARVHAALAAAHALGHAYWSIRLGGMAVLAGDTRGLAALEEHLPPVGDRFPMRLALHAAFHTPLLSDVSDKALASLGADLFQRPDLPLIDGRGAIWQPTAFDADRLHAYTFGHQIRETYEFSCALTVSLKEFHPDRLIVLGPGSTMGPPVAQTLIQHGWKGLTSKADFQAAQAEDPFVLASVM